MLQQIVDTPCSNGTKMGMVSPMLQVHNTWNLEIEKRSKLAFFKHNKIVLLSTRIYFSCFLIFIYSFSVSLYYLLVILLFSDFSYFSKTFPTLLRLFLLFRDFFYFLRLFLILFHLTLSKLVCFNLNSSNWFHVLFLDSSFSCNFISCNFIYPYVTSCNFIKLYVTSFNFIKLYHVTLCYFM